MAKISALPEKVEPNGDETVLILDGPIAKRASLKKLVAGATSEEVQVVGADLELGEESAVRSVAASLQGTNPLGVVAADLRLGAFGSYIMRSLQAAIDAVLARDQALNLVGAAARIKLIAMKGFAGGFADGAGRVFAVFRENGALLLSILEAKFATITAGVLASTPFRSGVVRGYSWTWGDIYGRFSGGFRNDGALAARRLVGVDTINGLTLTQIANFGAVKKQGTFKGNYVLHIAYGQSRSMGADAAVRTTTQPYDNLMFIGGARPGDNPTPANRRTSLVPLVDAAGTGAGATGLVGFSSMVKERILADYGLAHTDMDYRLICASEGSGGQAIANLAVGTVPYNNGLADIDAAAELALAAGKRFIVPSMDLAQAESDYQVNTPATTWATTVVNIRAGWDAKAKSYGQTDDVICIMDQVFGHAIYNTANPSDPYLALKQLEMASTLPNFWMACPAYMIPHAANIASNVHATAAGNDWRSAYYARVFQSVVIDRKPWVGLLKPKMPQPRYDSTYIYVDFTPESGALAWRTTLEGGQRANYGFSLAGSGGAAITLAALPTIIGKTVRIQPSVAPAAGMKVRYGFGAGTLLTAGGNLTDTMGDTIVADIGGLNARMDNWAPIFELTLGA
ncbi:hypothetical protein [Sphingomonas sp. PB4P5]|uniref:hypothetical protein n=1 Tax=Parasphingomonas puruogangriensis TaxID=3096155 RepID=UPI002FC6795C